MSGYNQTDAEADFEEMLAGYDRIINDKALQQELLDAGLLVRVDPATGKPLTETPKPPSRDTEIERVPHLLKIEGQVGPNLAVGTDWRITEIRGHLGPSGIQGVEGDWTTVIRFDPLLGQPASEPSLDVERLARAHEDIVTMYARHEPGWDVVHEWHGDPGDIFKARAAIAAIIDRAAEYQRLSQPADNEAAE